MLVSVPVYVKGTSRTTIPDRRRNLNGYVVGIFDLTQLLQSIRTATAASSDDRRQRLSAGPRPQRRAAISHRCRLFVGDAGNAGVDQGLRLRWRRRGRGVLRIGDVNWKVLAAFPPRAGG